MICDRCQRWSIVRTILGALAIGCAFTAFIAVIDCLNGKGELPHRVRPSIYIPIEEVTP